MAIYASLAAQPRTRSQYDAKSLVASQKWSIYHPLRTKYTHAMPYKGNKGHNNIN